MFSNHIEEGRQVFREVLAGPIRFTPDRTAVAYRFRGDVALGRLFSGIAGLAPFLASPAGNPDLCSLLWTSGFHARLDPRCLPDRSRLVRPAAPRRESELGGNRLFLPEVDRRERLHNDLVS